MQGPDQEPAAGRSKQTEKINDEVDGAEDEAVDERCRGERILQCRTVKIVTTEPQLQHQLQQKHQQQGPRFGLSVR
jgi:hypothetical protein